MAGADCLAGPPAPWAAHHRITAFGRAAGRGDSVVARRAAGQAGAENTLYVAYRPDQRRALGKKAAAARRAGKRSKPR